MLVKWLATAAGRTHASSVSQQKARPHIPTVPDFYCRLVSSEVTKYLKYTHMVYTCQAPGLWKDSHTSYATEDRIHLSSTWLVKRFTHKLRHRGYLGGTLNTAPMRAFVGESPRRVLVPTVRLQILAVVSRLERYSVEHAYTATSCMNCPST